MPSASAAPLRTCRVDLTLDLAAPRTSRSLLHLLLPQWGLHDPDILDGAALVVSELVTHALVQSDDSGPVAVGVELRDDTLRLWVLDRSPGGPAQGGSRVGTADARGLVIVGQIAVRWGVENLGDGLRSYADLPLLPVPV